MKLLNKDTSPRRISHARTLFPANRMQIIDLSAERWAHKPPWCSRSRSTNRAQARRRRADALVCRRAAPATRYGIICRDDVATSYPSSLARRERVVPPRCHAALARASLTAMVAPIEPSVSHSIEHPGACDDILCQCATLKMIPGNQANRLVPWRHVNSIVQPRSLI